MVQPPSINEFLLEETRALRAFFVLLEQERQHLEEAAIDQLLPLAAEKSRALAELNRLGLRRAGWLAEQGYGGGRTGARAWLAALDPQAPERATWQAMIQTAERVRDLNETNGALMRVRMQHNQHALAVLMAATDRAGLYGPDGHTRPGPGKRHFGAA